MYLTPGNILLFSLIEAAMSAYSLPHVFSKNSLASFYLVLVAVKGTIWCFHKLVIYPYFLSPLRHLPRPPKGFYPVIGHGLILFKRPPGEAFLNLLKQTKNDGLIHFRGVFHADRLLVASPAALADVLVHRSYDFEKPPWSRNFLRKFLGDGLLMTEGDEHRHQRKHIMPAFSFRNIRELYPVFWSKSIEMCEVVKRELWEKPDKVLDIGHFSTMVTLDIIGLAGLGRDIGSLRNNDDVLIENYEGMPLTRCPRSSSANQSIRNPGTKHREGCVFPITFAVPTVGHVSSTMEIQRKSQDYDWESEKDLR